MKTEDLVTILSHTTPPKQKIGLSTTLMALAVVSFALVLITLGVRTNLAESLANGGFWFKTAFMSAALILSLLMLRRSAYPVQKSSWVPAAYLGLWVALLIAAIYQIASTAFAGILPQWQSTTGLACLGYVFGYGLVAQIILVKVMQYFAPTDLNTAGRNIALAAAAAGAIGYSIHCTMDSPAYIIFAYGLPTLVLAVIGTKILPRFIRW